MEWPTHKETITESSLAGNCPDNGEGISAYEMAQTEEDDLLFHMSQVCEDALSPTSKKVIEKNTVPFTVASSATKTGTPLTIQRPISSGQNGSNFSYARPSQTDLTFSFRPPPGRQANVSKRNTSGNRKPKQNPVFPEEDRVLMGNDYGSPSPDIHPAKRNETSGHDTPDHQTLNINRDPSSTEQIVGTDGDNAQQQQEHLDQQDQTESRKNERQNTTAGTRDYEPNDEITLPTPKTAQKYKVVKNRKKQKSKPGVGQMKSSLLSNDDARPSEEDLFYLLIQRLRQREEQEAAGSALREQMKSEIVELSEENQTLRAQLEQYHSRQEELVMEISTKKCQSEHWKMKLSKFRHLLSGFGEEHNILRDEADSLKKTEAGLVQEKNELARCIDEIKVNIDQAAFKISQQPSQVAAITADFDVMRQALHSAQEKTAYYHDQLLYEQRRVSKLERHIQCSADEHKNQLKLTNNIQSRVIEKLDTAINHVQQKWESSQVAMRSAITPMLQECLESTNTLIHNNIIEKSDIESLSQSMANLASSLDTLATNSERDADITKAIQGIINIDIREQLEKVEESMSSAIITSHQLAETQECRGRLEEKLKSAEETVARLNEVVKELKIRENELIEESKRLQGRLVDFQKELNNAAFRSNEDVFPTISEIQIQLQTTSAALTEALESIKEKESQIESLQQELIATRLTATNIEERLEQLDREKTAVKDEMVHMESRIREELGRASVISRDKIKAQFEQQLHRVEREKSTILASVQEYKQTINELKATMSQSEDSASIKQAEMKERLAEKEENIQCLQRTLAECEALTGSLEIELAKYKKQKKPGQDAGTNTEDSPLEPHTELQEKINTLEDQLSRAQDEIRFVLERLSAAESAKSTLESGKARAKSEIHSLLQRVQESETWRREGELALHKLGIIESGDLSQFNWATIEGQLKTILSDQIQKASERHQEDESSVATDIQSKEVLCTEVIYRSQSVHTSSHASPTSHLTLQSRIPANSTDNSSSGCLPGSIVPFSHVRNAFPHMPYSPNGSLRDIDIQLPSTPQGNLLKKNIDTERPGKHTTPDKRGATHNLHPIADKQTPNRGQGTPNLTGSEMITSKVEPTRRAGTKRKARGQLTQESLTSVESPPVSGRIGESPIHNQSRAKHQVKREEAPKSILKGSTTLGENNIHRSAATKTPERPKNKKSKRCATSVAGSLSITDTPTVSGYFNNAASPVISASGNQRPKRRDHQYGLPTTRNITRGRRRSRGEYYGDRFNRDIQPPK